MSWTIVQSIKIIQFSRRKSSHCCGAIRELIKDNQMCGNFSFFFLRWCLCALWAEIIIKRNPLAVNVCPVRCYLNHQHVSQACHTPALAWWCRMIWTYSTNCAVAVDSWKKDKVPFVRLMWWMASLQPLCERTFDLFDEAWTMRSSVCSRTDYWHIVSNDCLFNVYNTAHT